jgi:hypothetical protein
MRIWDCRGLSLPLSNNQEHLQDNHLRLHHLVCVPPIHKLFLSFLFFVCLHFLYVFMHFFVYSFVYSFVHSLFLYFFISLFLYFFISLFLYFFISCFFVCSFIYFTIFTCLIGFFIIHCDE